MYLFCKRDKIILSWLVCKWRNISSNVPIYCRHDDDDNIRHLVTVYSVRRKRCSYVLKKWVRLNSPWKFSHPPFPPLNTSESFNNPRRRKISISWWTDELRISPSRTFFQQLIKATDLLHVPLFVGSGLIWRWLCFLEQLLQETTLTPSWEQGFTMVVASFLPQ